MSVEDLKKFGQLCNDDLDVRNRAKEIGLHDVEGLIAYGRELGLEFTTEDMLAAAKEAGVNMDELSEEELEKIAGGVITTTVGVLAGVAIMAGSAAAAGFLALMAGGVVAATAFAAGAVTMKSSKW